MIYKFNDYERGTTLEVQLYNEDNQPPQDDEYVEIQLCNESTEELITIDLSKKQLFKLIGALHCIQKEMK
jgi:hypothetical protein